ncbi:F-box domain containing protein [Colletotrichum truncatum]|uniref:F-box domain containing protein n=1 Tax=Colletotrichum truncatum TaxID=5467 RepID=A0ACC3YS03_COLTU
MTDKYILRVTAGPNYDADSQVEVPVNKPQPIKISTELADIELNVRIQKYAGLPRQSPETSSYFSTEPHATNNDQYSISFRFTPKKPEGATGEGISAADLQFGNDFDHPIRDRLPPGFNTAMNIVKWWIDPGLEGDAYADTPYLYGPALSSFNVVHAGAGTYDEQKGGLWFEEGGDDDGMEMREKIGAPTTSKERMKWALRKDSKEQWLFEYGKTYGMDFFNPYLDFSNLSLRLPGFQLAIMKYWDGQGLRVFICESTPVTVQSIALSPARHFAIDYGSKIQQHGAKGVSEFSLFFSHVILTLRREGEPKRSHQLRYVLRNRSTDQVYLVILFTIHYQADINEDGSIKAGAEGPKAGDLPSSSEDHHNAHDETKALDEARKQMGPASHETETNDDDVD